MGSDYLSIKHICFCKNAHLVKPFVVCATFYIEKDCSNFFGSKNMFHRKSQ